MVSGMHPWLLALIGGALIGVSAVMLMALLGRIAGVSGIVAALLPPTVARDWAWRIAFIAGLICGPLVVMAFSGASPIGPPAVSMPMLLVAGLAVGAGTALGGGCTSGHGICGISRLSPRSLAAVAVFMAAGIVTVFLVRHVL
jgi:uncharacterized membrane protein YedE/YeeE